MPFADCVRFARESGHRKRNAASGGGRRLTGIAMAESALEDLPRLAASDRERRSVSDLTPDIKGGRAHALIGGFSNF